MVRSVDGYSLAERLQGLSIKECGEKVEGQDVLGAGGDRQPATKVAGQGMTAEEFRATAAAATGAAIFVFEGSVCRVSDKFKHPGGDFIHQLHGLDVTEYIELAHATDAKVAKLLRGMTIGKLSDPDALVPSEVKDLRKLRRQHEADGRFARSNFWGFLRLGEPISLLILGCLLQMRFGYPVLGGTLQFLAFMRTTWWMHDVMHHAVLPDGAFAATVVDWLSFVVLGAFATSSWRKHSVHHVFTNVMEHDWNNLGPFQLDPVHANRSSPRFVRFQVILWFCLLVPLFGVLKICETLQGPSTYKTGLVIARVAIIAFFDWQLLLKNWAAMSCFLYLATLNHFHTDKVAVADERPDSFVRAMAVPSCNVLAGPLYSWFAGGLDLHVEHHLFPTLPHSQLWAVKEDVRALLSKYGIPYNELTLPAAMLENARQLAQPHRLTMPGVFPPTASHVGDLQKEQ